MPKMPKMPKLTKMPKIKETLRSGYSYKIDPPKADLRLISSFLSDSSRAKPQYIQPQSTQRAQRLFLRNNFSENLCQNCY